MPRERLATAVGHRLWRDPAGCGDGVPPSINVGNLGGGKLSRPCDHPAVGGTCRSASPFKICLGKSSARGETRTLTTLRSHGPEPCVSTNSTTRAKSGVQRQILKGEDSTVVVKWVGDEGLVKAPAGRYIPFGEVEKPVLRQQNLFDGESFDFSVQRVGGIRDVEEDGWRFRGNEIGEFSVF